MTQDRDIEPDTSLRERKRVLLKQTIERSAVVLAAEHGYDNVSVDMICEASMISQRTFFNYFGSKESVFLGTLPPLASDTDINRFVYERESDVFTDFLIMVVDSLKETPVDKETYQLRMEVLFKTPELAAKRLALTGALEDDYIAILQRRFIEEGYGSAPSDELEDEARMVISVIRGVMTYTTQKWFTPGYDQPVRVLLEDAIRLMRRIASREAEAR